jgi:hypothetical protein
MKSLTNCENPSSNPLPMLWSGDFGHENAYRNPPVVWNIILETALVMYKDTDYQASGLLKKILLFDFSSECTVYSYCTVHPLQTFLLNYLSQIPQSLYANSLFPFWLILNFLQFEDFLSRLVSSDLLISCSAGKSLFHVHETCYSTVHPMVYASSP